MRTSAYILLTQLSILMICSSVGFSIDKFSGGLKVGIGFSHLQPENLYELARKYPLSASFGFFSEFEVSKDFSIVSEIVFKRSLHESTFVNGEGGILETKLASTSLYFPISIKYLTSSKYIPYFLFGFGLNLPLKSEFELYDRVYNVGDSGDLTSQLPKFESSISLGIGKDIYINPFSILIEVRYIIGITDNTNTKFYFPSKWRHKNLEFLFGVKF